MRHDGEQRRLWLLTCLLIQGDNLVGGDCTFSVQQARDAVYKVALCCGRVCAHCERGRP